MKRLIERLQPLKTAVKSVFFISIAVLVVVELIRFKTNDHFRIAGVSFIRSVNLASCFDGSDRLSCCVTHALL